MDRGLGDRVLRRPGRRRSPPGRLLRLDPGARPCFVTSARRARPARSATRPRRRGRSRRRSASARSSGPGASIDDLIGAPLAAIQARSGLLVGMSPKRRTRSGASCVGRGAGDRGVGGDDERAGRAGRSEAREVGSASTGKPDASARAATAPGRSRIEVAPGDDQPPLRPLDRAGQGTEQLLARLAARDRHGQRAPLRPALEGERVGGAEIVGALLGAERVPPRRGSGGPGPRPPIASPKARQATERMWSRPASSASWVPTSQNHRAADPVEADLVDRLPGAHLAQLGRAVGGEHDQRHARLVGLDDGGVEVGRRRAARAGDDRRALRSPSAAPSAMKPAQRSSRTTVSSRASSRSRARAIGEEREPGERKAWRTPERASSSTSAEASAELRLVRSIIGCAVGR